MIEPAYWLRGGFPEEGHSYKWIVSNFLSIGNENTREYFRAQQATGVKIMIHIPFAYKNIDYSHLELYATIINMLNEEQGWLYNIDGTPCMLKDNVCTLIDLRNRNVVKKMIEIYVAYVVEQGFVPDAWFIDFIWDKINWICNHYPGGSVEANILDEDWKRAGNFSLGSLRYNFGKTGEEWREQLYYVNGWHHCRMADAMCYEGFPNTTKENGERGLHVTLYGEYGVREHKNTWTLPPMLMPFQSPQATIQAVAFASKYCHKLGKDSIIVDNSGSIFDALED